MLKSLQAVYWAYEPLIKLRKPPFDRDMKFTRRHLEHETLFTPVHTFLAEKCTTKIEVVNIVFLSCCVLPI